MNTKHSPIAKLAGAVVAMSAICLLQPSAFAAGFTGASYEVSSGNFNADGLPDYLVREKRTIVPVQNGAISVPIVLSASQPDFVMQQTTDGEFELIDIGVTIGRQLARDWPQIDAIYDRRDINFDGHLDAILRIPGELPQLIFAGSVEGSIPQHSKTLDEQTGQFFDDVWNWLNADIVTETTTESGDQYAFMFSQYASGGNQLLLDCLASGFQCGIYVGNLTTLYNDNDRDCHAEVLAAGQDPNGFCVFGYHLFIEVEYQQTTERRDYDLTHPDAGEFASIFEDFWDQQDVWVTDQDDLDLIVDILEGILRAPVVDLDAPAGSEDLNGESVEEWSNFRVIGTILGIVKDVCERNADGDAEAARACFGRADIGQHPLTNTVCGNRAPYDANAVLFDYSITPAQRAHFNNQQRRAFWLSRYQDSCDPFANAALAVVDNVGFGRVTLKWLARVAQAEGVVYDEFEVGMSIIEGHINYTDTDFVSVPHLLSPRQITEYHVAQFALFGLPPRTFGGAPLGIDDEGNSKIASLSASQYWCRGCDRFP